MNIPTSPRGVSNLLPQPGNGTTAMKMKVIYSCTPLTSPPHQVLCPANSNIFFWCIIYFIFIFFPALLRYGTQIKIVYLMCTICCFGICMHCEMITIIKLINMPIILHKCVCVLRTLKIYSCCNFQVYFIV